MIAGHITVTYALHQGLKNRVPAVRSLALAPLLAGAFLPDMLDKPFSYLFHIPGRGMGHSLLVLAVLFYPLFRAWPQARRWVLALFIGSLLHLIEDAATLNVVFWPLLGGWKFYHDFGFLESLQLYYTGKIMPELLAIEIISYPFCLYYLLRPKPRPALIADHPAA